MTLSLKAFSDAALSGVLPSLNVLQKTDGTTGPVDIVFYLGSNAVGKKIEASSNPGVDNIVLSVVDASTGAGQAVGAVKLATSSAGLDSAIAGDPLTLSTSILSGSADAVVVYARLLATDLTAGTYADLSLQTNPLVEADA
jgi:catabolite regulation protein CreA